MLISRHQNAGQDHNTKVANRAFENVAKFKYLGTIVTNQNWIHGEIKSRIILATSVHNLLSSRLPCRNIKIKIYEKHNFACTFVWV
jgi:hypothetical protein